HMSSLGVDEEGDCWRATLGDAHMRWSGAAGAQAVADGHGGKALRCQLELAPGEHHDFILALELGGQPALDSSCDRLWESTERAWHARIPSFEDTIAPRDARHAYAVLDGLTTGRGGMVAAATTSLPERAERGRNYDYRYVWIRDQAYAGEAVAAAGPYPLLDDAVRFVSERVLSDGPNLSPAYTVIGTELPEEHDLDLPGYPGGDAKVGNQVTDQFQLDAFGEALLLLAA